MAPKQHAGEDPTLVAFARYDSGEVLCEMTRNEKWGQTMLYLMQHNINMKVVVAFLVVLGLANLVFSAYGGYRIASDAFRKK